LLRLQLCADFLVGGHVLRSNAAGAHLFGGELACVGMTQLGPFADQSGRDASDLPALLGRFHGKILGAIRKGSLQHESGAILTGWATDQHRSFRVDGNRECVPTTVPTTLQPALSRGVSHGLPRRDYPGRSTEPLGN
jgi:hypothetical protein